MPGTMANECTKVHACLPVCLRVCVPIHRECTPDKGREEPVPSRDPKAHRFRDDEVESMRSQNPEPRSWPTS